MKDIIIWAAMFQGLLLALIYMTSKSHKSFSNKLLGLFLLALLWEAFLIFFSIDQIGNYYLFEYFALPEPKLFLPLLFFHYILSKIRMSAKYNKYLKYGYILAFAVVSFTFINVMIFLFSGKSLIDLLGESSLNTIFMTQQTIACLLCVLVLIISSFELKRYQIRVQDQVSDISLSNIKWLWQLIYSMSIATLLWSIELIRIAIGGSGSLDIVMITWGVLFVFIYFASYKAFVNKDLFEVASERITDSELTMTKSADSNNKISTEDLDNTISKLEEIMDKEKLFLQPDLTIHDLSKMVSISSRKISQCIKIHFGRNFSEWVNKYRVDYAKKMLNDFTKNNLTIEGIGYDAGFNSRSAMYLAFKKITGQTPGKFKA